MTRLRLELILVGFGNVARRAVTLLEEMGARLPFEWKVIAILTARHGCAYDEDGLEIAPIFEAAAAGRSLDGFGSLSTSTTPGILAGSRASEISALCEQRAAVARSGQLVCIETTVLDIRGGEPATSHIRAALAGGAHAMTANKGPVAFFYHELAELARSAERELLFEGVVMDGIPIFNLVRRTLPGVRITRFRGVVNSTTNHILTRLEQGETFEAALAQMQAEGIAEADSALDVDGWDAAAKTAALMNVLMDARVTPHDIEREGIRGVEPSHARDARAGGERLRLVASADSLDGQVTGRVQLERVPASDLLAGLEGQQNALLLGTDLLGEIGIVQRTGGLTQTAYAIVSDLTAIAGRASRA